MDKVLLKEILDFGSSKQFRLVGDMIYNPIIYLNSLELEVEKVDGYTPVERGYSPYSLGGVGNIALNLAEWGAKVTLLSFIAKDDVTIPQAFYYNPQVEERLFRFETLSSGEVRKTYTETRYILDEKPQFMVKSGNINPINKGEFLAISKSFEACKGISIYYDLGVGCFSSEEPWKIKSDFAYLQGKNYSKVKTNHLFTTNREYPQFLSEDNFPYNESPIVSIFYTDCSGTVESTQTSSLIGKRDKGESYHMDCSGVFESYIAARTFADGHPKAFQFANFISRKTRTFRGSGPVYKEDFIN